MPCAPTVIPPPYADIMNINPAPTFADLFAGAGGLSLGLSRAGWKPVYAQDYWDLAMATYQLNLGGHLAEHGDIHELDAKRLHAVFPERPDWIVGGPPCQGYSTVGKRRRDDSRNVLFKQFLRVLSTVKPSGFVIENVLGLKDMRFEEEVADAFREVGYSVIWQVVSAADYGVPQVRRRVLFIGHRDAAFKGLPPTTPHDRRVSVGDAIGDLPPLAAGEAATTYLSPPTTAYQRQMRRASKSLQGHEASAHPPHLVKAISFIPDGGNRTAIPARLQPSSGFHNSYSRLASWLPAVAVTQNMGKPSASRCIHPFQHRGLTTREGARLQSFPDTFHFAGPVTHQRLQVANAVPPRLAEALGRGLLTEELWS